MNIYLQVFGLEIRFDDQESVHFGGERYFGKPLLHHLSDLGIPGRYCPFHRGEYPTGGVRDTGIFYYLHRSDDCKKYHYMDIINRYDFALDLSNWCIRLEFLSNKQQENKNTGKPSTTVVVFPSFCLTDSLTSPGPVSSFFKCAQSTSLKHLTNSPFHLKHWPIYSVPDFEIGLPFLNLEFPVAAFFTFVNNMRTS